MEIQIWGITGNQYNFSRESKLVERAKALKVNAGTEPDADLGPVISKQVTVKFFDRILKLILIVMKSSITFHFWTLIKDIYVGNSVQAKERICKLVQSGVESGARLLLDGRNIVVYFSLIILFLFYNLNYYLVHGSIVTALH